MTPGTITNADILAAAARASGYGMQLFSMNDLYTQLGFIPGKGPRWNGRQQVLPGNKISTLLLSNGYIIRKEYSSRASTRRYCRVALASAAGDTA